MASLKITCRCGALLEIDAGKIMATERGVMVMQFQEAHDVCNIAEEEQIHDGLLTLEGMHEELKRIANALEKLPYEKR